MPEVLESALTSIRHPNKLVSLLSGYATDDRPGTVTVQRKNGINQHGVTDMRGVIKKWGNSAAVRLPSPMLKSLRLGIEDRVDIRVESGCIVLEPVLTDDYRLSDLLNKINHDNLHHEIDFGTPG